MWCNVGPPPIAWPLLILLATGLCTAPGSAGPSSATSLAAKQWQYPALQQAAQRWQPEPRHACAVSLHRRCRPHWTAALPTSKRSSNIQPRTNVQHLLRSTPRFTMPKHIVFVSFSFAAVRGAHWRPLCLFLAHPHRKCGCFFAHWLASLGFQAALTIFLTDTVTTVCTTDM